jgi:hypothetical protein
MTKHIPSEPPAPDDPVPEELRAVLALFAGALGELSFPDVDAAVLDRAADEVRASAHAVERARGALDAAQRALDERTAALAALAGRGLAYARIYADAHPELSGLADALGALEVPAAPRSGTPRKPRRRRAEQPRPELPFAAAKDGAGTDDGGAPGDEVGARRVAHL